MGSLTATERLQCVEDELRDIEVKTEGLLWRQQVLRKERESLQRMASIEVRAPKADWSTSSFEWDDTALEVLKNTFGLRSWRPLQREAINASLQGRDVFCIMPAGGGKSLCYQLPAVLAPTGNVTLVISPLLALITDQVNHLQALNVKATSLTSLSTREEFNETLRLLDRPETSPALLYVTPERIAKSKRLMSKLDKLYKSNRLFRIAVDESHCASQWGNDFRPDYRKLGVLRQQYRDVPIIALTATATASVIQDVVKILLIEGCEILKGPINRPNLYYEVVPKPRSDKEVAEDIARWITRNFPVQETGLIYCLTKKDCEYLCSELQQHGIRTGVYHADMEAKDRILVHESWANGHLQVICCTIAFGMGVNHTAVRFVIHQTMSKSVENYYQESGRAGRDGNVAHVRLYYRFSDYLKQAAVVSMESSWESHLRGMLIYVTSHSCRRSTICSHFGEAPAECHNMCDKCLIYNSNNDDQKILESQPAKKQRIIFKNGEIDIVGIATAIVSLLELWPGEDKRATLNQLIDSIPRFVSGDLAKHIKLLDRDDKEHVVEALLLMDALKVSFGFTAYSTNVYLKLGPNYRNFADLNQIKFNWPSRKERQFAMKPRENCLSTLGSTNTK